MKKNGNDDDPPQELRRSAEAKLAAQYGAAYEMLQRDPLALIHELQVHQIELEMQNEELRRAQSEAHELYERFQDLYDFAPVCYLTLDGNGKIREANLTAASLLGVERRSLLRTPFTAFLSRPSLPAFQVFITQVLAAGVKQTCEVEFIYGKKTTGRAIIEGIAVASADDGEKHIRIALMDITERREMEDRIIALNSELELKAAKLEEANRDLQWFVRAVSHDLKNPIFRICSAAQMLEEQADGLDGEGNKMLAAISRTCFEMGETITALLELSRAAWGPSRRKETDLSRIAADIAAQLRLKDPERDAAFVISSGLTADCDPVLMKVVLENLMGNAWKFTSSGSNARIEFGRGNKGNESPFFVRDNGIGFDMAEAEGLFNPFHRLDSGTKFEGHGVGLETARRIIERHGGKIWAESEPGKGTTFFFTLPDGHGADNA